MVETFLLPKKKEKEKYARLLHMSFGTMRASQI